MLAAGFSKGWAKNVIIRNRVVLIGVVKIGGL